MPWQERGFMLYTNEEPLVQRTCIKTASLQSEVSSNKELLPGKSTSEVSQSEEVSSKNLFSKEESSGKISSKEPEYKVPEELKLQTLICGHQVLTSLSDKSLVSICQNPQYADSDSWLSAVVCR